MKKVLFILMALLIATPVMAATTLTESGKSYSPPTVTVGYNCASGGFPRAFALVLQATGGTITSVTPIKEGVSTTSLKGYGIFPGTIAIDSGGNMTSAGTPVEPTGLPGGPSALGTSRVVVALGSLYGPGDANKPAAIGNLFTVVCSAGTTSLAVSEEDTYRGGVVDVNAVGLTVATINITLTAPAGFTLTTSVGTASGNVTVPGIGAFGPFTTPQTITAVATSGYHFVNWTGTGAAAGKIASTTSASTTITMDADYTAIANFAVNPETITGTPVVTKTTALPAIAGRINKDRVETFVASGVAGSLGGTLEYQFTWGDGVVGSWGAATQTHTYTVAMTKTSTFNVTAQARLQATPATVSAVSAPVAEAAEAVKSTSTFYTTWATTFSRPACWAFARNCRGDINGLKSGYTAATYIWVNSADLTIFAAAFNAYEPALKLIVSGGFPGICADNNRIKSGYTAATYIWVNSADLTVFANYFNDYEPIVPVCDQATNYHYWTN